MILLYAFKLLINNCNQEMSVTINANNDVNANHEVGCRSSGCRCVPIASKELPVSIKLHIENDMKAKNTNKASVNLPVETIENLSVQCELVVNQNGMSLGIICKNVSIYDKDEVCVYLRPQTLFKKTYIKKLTKYTLKDYATVLRHIQEDIKLMKFDVLNGVLTLPDLKHPRESPHVRSQYELKNFVPCDEQNPDECCVCLEITKTTTGCGHKLCVLCWDKIKKNKSELPCPICRADLKQAKKFDVDVEEVEYDDDYDDEDDDEEDDWSYDSDSDIEYAEFPEPIEFPSVRQSNIMDMY